MSNNELSKQLRLAREIISKNRELVLTKENVKYEGLITAVRRQLRDEILKEFDETFMEKM